MDTDERAREVSDELNDRPRKCLEHGTHIKSWHATAGRIDEPYVPGGRCFSLPTRPLGCYWPSRETAWAMTSASSTKPPKASSPISALARAESGMVSVGLKAMELDSEK